MATLLQLQLPMNIGLTIDHHQPVFLIKQIVDSLNHPFLNTSSWGRGRKAKLTNRQLLAVLLYSYSEGIYSSRKISERLKRDTHYMYLTDGIPVTHTTINNFRLSLTDGTMDELFILFVKQLKALNEVRLETLYLDGTKIEAYANRYTFIWHGWVEKHEAKLQEKVRALFYQIEEELSLTFYYPLDEKISVEIMDHALMSLKHYAEQQGIEMVRGKGKRQSSVQRYIETLEDYIYRQTMYDTYYDLLDGRNSFSKTDPDATFMRMKDDHMNNGQLKPAYNVQVGMEGGYVIGVDIYHYTTDMPTLIPFIRKVQQDYHGVIQNVVADSGYASEKNYDFLERNRSQIYIPYQSYYQEKTRKFRQDIGKRQNMAYDSERDVYRCANNRELVYSGTDYDKRDAEYTVKKKVYRCTDCHDCPLRRQCMPYSKREDTNKTVSYSENFERQKQRVYSNLTSEHGIRLRMNRKIQTEGFFGIMKEDYHFRRFLLRGTEKVRVEVLLLAFAFNFRRLYNKQRAGLNGTFIEYEVKEAA